MKHECPKCGFKFAVAILSDRPVTVAPPEAMSASPDEVSMPKAWVEAAQCGNCGGQGWKAIQIEAGVFDQEQCQWCYERWLALGQPMLTPSPQLRQEEK